MGAVFGFFHGTGHGLGLEIHEYPPSAKGRVESGTMSHGRAGLYYPGIGGARIEDVVIVGKNRL